VTKQKYYSRDKFVSEANQNSLLHFTRHRKNWDSQVAMLLGSFQICWQILYENTIFTYNNTFCSKKSCQNTSCATKVSAAFGILSNSGTGSFGNLSIPAPHVALTT
jgi:hypothetical protein